MHEIYERDLDLNLLRVFVVVADAGSVTAAAARLYLTQPAVSAALRRLAVAVGAPLFARAGRALVLTARGHRLLAAARPHLHALVTAARAPAALDLGTARRTIRLGVSDASEAWLLAPLVRRLGAVAPGLRLIATPVQFRTVGALLAGGALDLAVTVADELPAAIRRRTLFVGGFVCLFDPRHAEVGTRLTLARYLAHGHVVVSYNGDLRGVVEDAFGIERDARVAVPGFHGVGALVEGGPLLATVPRLIAETIRVERPRLRTIGLPPELRSPGAPIELLWPGATDDDELLAWLRGLIVAVTAPIGAALARARVRA